MYAVAFEKARAMVSEKHHDTLMEIILFIFFNLNTGNTICEAVAIGPIMQGLNKTNR